jgi:hypothetical protein
MHWRGQEQRMRKIERMHLVTEKIRSILPIRVLNDDEKPQKT